MDVTVEADEIQVTDPTKSSLTIYLDGWTPMSSGPELDRPVDAIVTGETTRIEFPSRFCAVTDQEAEETVRLGGRGEELSLDEGRYVVRISAEVKTFVTFEHRAAVRRDNDEIYLEFPNETNVTVGFRSLTRSPSKSIQVPPTPEGLATALSYTSSAIRSDTPDRSYHSMRGHPPLVETGPETQIPDAVKAGTTHSGIRINVPADFDYLFPAASLAHYLSAAVDVGVDRPEIVADGRRFDLGPHPTFERSVNGVLRRVFFLDCVARQVGPHGMDLPHLPTPAEIGLSSESLYKASIADRLWAYIDAPFEQISDEFPRWHFCMYVEPTQEHIEVLPYLINDLAAIYRPVSEDLPSDERLSRSLDDFYRGKRDSGPKSKIRSIEDAPTVTLSKPRLQEGDIHGWLGQGTPIDVFKSIPEAYENRSKYRERSEDSISIVAVLNDEEMSEEHAEVADIYRERAKDLSLNISIRENLRTDELVSTLETDHDLLHFVGHCEEGGLRCPDGTLAVSSITESNVQTFFLNACGSYYEGLDLVRKGSVAGAITFKTVLDEQAALVGTMFARLAAHGFSIERALELASRRVMMNKDYAVVGDGTHVLSQSINIVGPETRLEESGSKDYILEYTVRAPWMTGASFTVRREKAEHTLFGDTLRTEWNRDELVSFLENADCPVVYDGDLHWSDEIIDQL